MEIYERIKLRRKELGLSAETVAEKLGVSPATIYRYEKKDIKKFPTDILEPLARVLKTTPAFLLGYDDNPMFSIPNIIPIPKMKKIPLLGTIACGEPILAEENIDAYISVDENSDATFALKCKGDSMITARIFDGDVVYIRPQPDVENGEIAAVLIDNEATLKKVYKAKNKITLSPCNPMYADMVYTDEQLNTIKILGKAVAFTSVIRNS